MLRFEKSLPILQITKWVLYSKQERNILWKKASYERFWINWNL